MKTAAVPIVTAVLLAACVPGSDTLARPLNDLPYAILVREADVIVIATVVSSRRVDFDFNTLEPWASLLRTPEGPDVRAVLVAEVTTFRVKAVLKGNVEGGATIGVFHFSLTGPWPDSVLGAPHLFKKGLAEEIVDGEVRSTGMPGDEGCVLFLTGPKDGRFEPVTGQMDSVYSVKQIRSLVDGLGRKLTGESDGTRGNAGTNQEGVADERAVQERRSDASCPRLMRWRWRHRG
jgi:hypothetical protein